MKMYIADSLSGKALFLPICDKYLEYLDNSACYLNLQHYSAILKLVILYSIL